MFKGEAYRPYQLRYIIANGSSLTKHYVNFQAQRQMLCESLWNCQKLSKKPSS
ncbi:MAG: hypothetical protein LBH59_07380 [Planctomycetaceae bacterium]|nr:hypothetical protein [Planctomycetaceae bacterium]